MNLFYSHYHLLYLSYCFDCNNHLCKDCLKTGNHKYHYKINIIEILPEDEILDKIRSLIQKNKIKINQLKKDKTKTEERLSNILNKNIEKIKSKKKENKEKNNKKEKDEKFEECWLAYNRKGSKAKALEYWNKLSDADKALVLPHIKVYVSTRERVYQKDFERYLRDKIFKTIIVKGNDTIYDPEQFTNKEEYRPITDGVFQIWNPERKCLLFNGFIDQLNDGYTSDTRPDGAKVAWNMYEWVWSSQRKEWVKQWLTRIL